MMAMEENRLVRDLLDRRDQLLGMLLAQTRDYDVAEEVFQEMALEVVKEAGRGTQVERFLPWIREVARRRLAEYFRRRARRGAELLPGALVDSIGMAFEEEEVSADENRARQKALLECIERLPSRSREVVRRRYGEWLPLERVAQAVAWKVSSVKVALSRARRALMECVERKIRAEEAS